MRSRILALLLLALGCRSGANRPVEEGGDAAALGLLLRHSVPVTPRVRSVLEAGADDALQARGGPATPTEGSPSARSLPELPLDVLFADTPATTDVGLPVRFDFGAGEAPFDDGTLPIHRGCVGPSGFSDAILSLVWRQPLTSAVRLQGRAAVVRAQDLALMDGFSDARFAFLVLGLSVSF